MASEESKKGGAGTLAEQRQIHGARRYRNGVLASILWVVAAGLLVWFRRADLCTMELNQWGDFFAGVFAPLAFLWLVLGYLQQGDELRLSTDALRLQARELSLSVLQQRELVAATREQVETEKSALAQQGALLKLRTTPRWKIVSHGRLGTGEAMQYGYQIINVGADVTSVHVLLVACGDHTVIYDKPIGSVSGGGTDPIDIYIGAQLSDDFLELTISFIDGLFEQGKAVFDVEFGRFSEEEEWEFSFSPSARQ
jgi:hypothetical protein